MKVEEWTCPHEIERHDIKFGNLSFQDWYMIRFGDAIINAGLIRKLKLDYEEHRLQEFVDEKSIKDDISCKDDYSCDTNDKTIWKHWCEKIKTVGEIFWASCNLFDEGCDGGSSMARVGDDDFL